MTVKKFAKNTDRAGELSWKKNWRDFDTKLCPIPDKDISVLATQLEDFAVNTDAIKITEFLTEKRISYQVFYNCAERHPELARAIQFAKIVIGDRRERRGLEGKYNANMVMSTMAIYDPEYKNHYEWKVKLAKENKEQSETKIVVIEKYPESPMVPQKKEID